MMQIKEAYDRRIKQKLTPRKYLPQEKNHHANTIGSIRTGKVNYRKVQKFFEDCGVRDDVLEAKNYVKELIDPDYLELKDRKWNSSVSVPKKFEDEEDHKSKLMKIRLGFSDFKDFERKPNKMYAGTEGRDDYTGWNVSTFVTKKQKQMGHLYTNANALKNSVTFNSRKLPNYKTLKDRYREDSWLQKDEIMNNSDIISEMKQSFLFFNPGSSPQKTSAVAHKMFEQHKRDQLKLSLQSMGTQDSFSNFKANLSPTQKMKIRSEYYHTGTWSSQIRKQQKKEDSDEEQEGVWSCCMSGDKNARGCSKRIIDANKMNLVSYT